MRDVQEAARAKGVQLHILKASTEDAPVAGTAWRRGYATARFVGQFPGPQTVSHRHPDHLRRKRCRVAAALLLVEPLQSVPIGTDRKLRQRAAIEGAAGGSPDKRARALHLRMEPPRGASRPPTLMTMRIYELQGQNAQEIARPAGEL